MRKQIRKAMICTIAMMLVAIVTLTGVTYAWFSQSDTSTISGIDISLVKVSGIIDISDEANPLKWGTTLPLDISRTDFMPASTAPSSIATDGTLKFFSGRLGAIDGETLCTEPIAVELDGNPKYYVKKDIYIRNTTNAEMNIVIDQLVTSAGNANAAMAMRLAIVNHGAYEVTGPAGSNNHTANSVNNKVLKNADGTYNVCVYEFDAKNHLLVPDGEALQTYGVKTATVVNPSEELSTDPKTGEYIYAEPGRYTQEDFENELIEEDQIGTLKSEDIFFDMIAHQTAAGVGEDAFLEKVHLQGKDITNDFVIKVAAGETDADTGDFVPSYHKITIYLWLEGQDVDCINAIGGQSLPITIGLTQIKAS